MYVGSSSHFSVTVLHLQQVYETVQKNVEEKLLILLLGIHAEPDQLETFRQLLR